MVFSRLSDLPPVAQRAIIINVRTVHTTTLAILSTLRHAQMPVVLMDCEPDRDSATWFRQLMERQPFDLVVAPIRKHGEALDVVFREIACDQVLLVDSDVEVLNDLLLRQMRKAMALDDRVFGSGYLHPAQWLDYHWDTGHRASPGIAYYVARPWIPFTLLRVSHVRDALSAGCSFMHKLVLNDIPQSRVLSRLLALRFRAAALRNLPLRGLDPFRRIFDGFKPCYVHYDTGAGLHEHLVKRGLKFAAVSNADEVPWTVRHLGGATRTELHGEGHDSVSVADAKAYAKARLLSEYGTAVPDGIEGRPSIPV